MIRERKGRGWDGEGKEEKLGEGKETVCKTREGRWRKKAGQDEGR